MVSLEAIACGRPVITHISSIYDAYKDFPLKDINIVDKVIETIEEVSPRLWKAEYNYLIKYHKPEETVKRMCNSYTRVINI